MLCGILPVGRRISPYGFSLSHQKRSPPCFAHGGVAPKAIGHSKKTMKSPHRKELSLQANLNRGASRAHRVKSENLLTVLALLQKEGFEAHECPPPTLDHDTDFPHEGQDSCPMAGVRVAMSGMAFHRFLVRHGVTPPWSRHDK